MGFDVLELLSELQEGGPRGSVQLPAVLHHLIDCRWAAVRSIHLVALLHPRDDVLEGLRADGWQESVQELTPGGDPYSASLLRGPLWLWFTHRPRSGLEVPEGKLLGLRLGRQGPGRPHMSSTPACPTPVPTLTILG